MNTENIEEVRGQCGVQVHTAMMGMIVFAVLALLLNAVALQRNASLMEFGWKRQVCLAFIKPVAGLSETLHIDDFRGWVESINFLEKSDEK
jgi:hypothetical protein